MEFDCPICNKGKLIYKEVTTKEEEQVGILTCNYFKTIDDKCDFKFWQRQFNYELTDEDLTSLFQDGETEFLELTSTSSGKDFTAKFKIVNNSIELEFPEAINTELSGAKCPACESKIIETNKSYLCEQYPEKACNVYIPKTVSHKNVSEKNARLLLDGKLSDMIHDFSTNEGELFSSRLMIDDTTHKVVFNNTIFDCPKKECDGTVVRTAKTYRCSNNTKENPKCDYVFFKEISGATIDVKTYMQLVEKGRTTSALSFISKKTNKPFSAKLILSSDGKLNFDFEQKKK